MRHPLYLLFLSSFAGMSLANNAAWNCTQDKNSKEWLCVGEKQPDSSGSVEIPEQAESAPSSASRDSKPETEFPRVMTDPGQAPQPVLPKAADIDQPAVIKFAEGVKPTPSPPQKPSPRTAQASETSRRAGWTCNADDAGNDWNCNLIGADPKGEARIIQSAESKFALLDPAFDEKQEQIFNTLTSHLKYDPWENCTIQISAPPDYIPGKHLRDTSPL
ncbi:MAG: LPS-assembly protein LptD, partial [Gammaproteobacteria bacterium]